MRTVRLLAAALLGLSLGSAPAGAQTWPDKVVRMVVPFTPGGPVDAAARVVSQHVQARLGQSIVIENRAGGGTTIGTPPTATRCCSPGRSSPTCRTSIPTWASTWSRASRRSRPWSRGRTSWWWRRRFQPRTVGELVAYAKQNPGKLVFGFGLATTPHILGETFKRVTGADIVSVSYRGGEQARADLLGGRVHINIAPIPNLRALIEEGKARPLAFTGPARSPDLPDVPTMTESGLPEVGFNPDVWLGIMAPLGTPAAVVETLNAAVNASLASPELKAALVKLGYEPKPMTPWEFSAFLAAELRKWPPLLATAGLKAE